MQVTIYHNPRCSKSRETLALLQDRGIEPRIVHYLEAPPDAETLRALLDGLGMSARELIRTGESRYKELGLADESLSEDALIRAMQQHPELIQRPIVVAGDKVRLGRPPEQVIEILP